MNGEYIVLSILKENGVTIGAKVTDGERIVKMYTNSLAKRYKEGYRFKNAVLTSEGFVKSRKGYDRLSVEEVSSNKIIVYHASAKGIQGKISATKSKGRNDFGNGFYLGEYKEQTLNRICNEKTGYVYTCELDMSNLSVYEFKDSILWAIYVGVNRGRIKVSSNKLKRVIADINNHDVIIGVIADDKIAKSFSMFLDETITDKALDACLKEVKYGTQYVLKTVKATNNCKILKKEVVTLEDRKKSKEWGQSLKEDLDLRLKDILRQNRHSGRYIDEILRGYIND